MNLSPTQSPRDGETHTGSDYRHADANNMKKDTKRHTGKSHLTKHGSHNHAKEQADMNIPP